MSRVLLIARRELAGYFHGQVGYVLGALFCAVQGFSFWAVVKVLADPRRPAQLGAVLRTYFGGTFLYWSFLFAVVAALSMRLVAEERRSGTWEALLTAGVGPAEAVVGKWLGALGYYVALWLPTLLYVPVLYWLAPPGSGPELAPIACGYLGVMVTGASLLAVGIAASSATANQLVAAFTTFAVLLALLLFAQLPELTADRMATRPGVVAVLRYVDLRSHMEGFGRGIIDSRVLLFHAAVTMVGLALAAALAGVGHRRGGDMLAVVLLLVVGVLGNVLGSRHPARLDVTVGQVNSLAPETVRVLRSVKEPVQLLIVRAGSPRLVQLYAEVDRLIQRMAQQQPLLRVREIDPMLEPGRLQELAAEFSLTPEVVAGEGAVVFQIGQRQRPVELLGMAELTEDALGADGVAEFRAEQAFAAALLAVLDEQQPTLCATRGHGELTGAATADLERRLGRVGARFVVVGSVDGGVPAYCRALLVLGPTAPLSAAAAGSVGDYLQGGGSLLLALSSDQAEPGRLGSHGLELVLARYGMRTPDGIVIDPARQLPLPLAWGTYDTYGVHPITSAFRGRRLTVWIAPRPVLLAPAEAEFPVQATALVTSSSTGWAESDLRGLAGDRPVVADESDLLGPVPVAAAVYEPVSGARVVVLGSARALHTEVIERGLGANTALAVESAVWLYDGAEAVTLDDKTPEQLRLVVSESGFRFVFAVCVIGIPMVLAGVGLGVWWWRRRRYG